MPDRNTIEIAGVLFDYPPVDGGTVTLGHMAAINADGEVADASDTLGLVVVGRVDQKLPAGKWRVKRGVFGWALSATNPPDITHVGKLVYVEDSETVSTVAGTGSVVAGRLLGVGALAWVDTGFHLADPVIPAV